MKNSLFFAAACALALAAFVAVVGALPAPLALSGLSAGADLPAHLLLATAGLPAALADELRGAVDGLVDGFDQFKKKSDTRARELEARLDSFELRSNRPSAPGERGSFISESARERELRALGAFARSGAEIEQKDMQVGDDQSGGYIVMPALSRDLTKRIFDQSPIRRLARVIELDSGAAWQEPVDKDDAGASWVGETETRGSTSTPDLGLLTVPLRELWAQQRITQTLLDVSHVEVGRWVEEKLADKFARLEGEAFVNGDTPVEPQGFMTLDKSALGDLASRPATALQFVVSGAATEITADSLRDLYWTLRAAHRANSTWLMASATANAIDKLKSGDGAYLWRDSSISGVSPTLLGRPVEFCEDMPSIGAGTFPIALGDWSRGYVIVDRLGLRFVRDPYSSKPFVLFDAFKRVGGGVANSDAIKLLKIAAS